MYYSTAVCCCIEPSTKIFIGEFDKYVKPAHNAQWSEAAMTVHGNQPSDERIKSASEIETVWKEFVAFIEGHLSGGIHSPNKKSGIFAAWGGKACDCERLFQVVEETHVGTLFMPNGVKYFHDPLTVICNLRSCKLHSKYQPAFIGGSGGCLVLCERRDRAAHCTFLHCWCLHTGRHYYR